MRGDEQELRICGNTSSIWRIGSEPGESSHMIFGSHKDWCIEIVEISCARYD